MSLCSSLLSMSIKVGTHFVNLFYHKNPAQPTDLFIVGGSQDLWETPTSTAWTLGGLEAYFLKTSSNSERQSMVLLPFLNSNWPSESMPLVSAQCSSRRSWGFSKILQRTDDGQIDRQNSTFLRFYPGIFLNCDYLCNLPPNWDLNPLMHSSASRRGNFEGP